MNAFSKNSKLSGVRKNTILIVDDNSTSLALVSRLLEDANFNILAAEDGESGLKKAHHAKPDLILLDVMMPGVDGFEICRRLKCAAETNDIPVILMTALTDSEHKVRGFESGAVDYVTKPLQMAEVLARIGVHLHIRELTRRLQQANESLEKRVDERTVELMTSERQRTDIINFLPDAIFAVDLEGRITLWNRTAEEFTGAKSQDMIGKGNHEYALPFYGIRRPLLIDLVLTPSLQIDQLFSSLKRINETVIGEAYTNRVKRGGAYVLAVAAPLYDSGGRMVGAIESVRDITDSKRAEEALRQSEGRFREIFEQHQDAVLLLNSTTLGLVDANVAAEQLYGLTREELIKSITERFFDPGDYEEFRSFIGEVRSNGSGYLANKVSIIKNGVKIPVAIRGQLIQLQGEDVVFCSFKDVTKKIQLEREAREAEAKLINANKMASLGMLVSSIAHEINNPNNYIMSNASLLTATWKDAMEVLEEHAKEHGEFHLGGVPFSIARKEVPALLSGLKVGTRRINAIVNSLKDFVRQDGSSLEECVDVGKAVMVACQIVEHQIKKRTVNFYLDVEEKNLYVRGNAQQLEQVVINLVINALSSLPNKDGRMFVSVSHPEHSGYVEITVRDEGVGIPKSVLARVFEPFFTTNRESGGTGLGLYISRSIVEKHNGVIEFESEPGTGTTVTVKLPISPNGQE